MTKKLLRKLLGTIGYSIQRKGGILAEADPFAVMQRLCVDKIEPVIFDVGAHHGETALWFRRILPNSTIYCFEPFPESYNALSLAVGSDPKIKPFNYGLAAINGIHKFHSNESSATNSLLPAHVNGPLVWGEGLLNLKGIQNCSFKMLDCVLQELSIASIDILKLDVQGAEPLVLEGAAGACAKRSIGIVYAEIILQDTYVGQKRFDEVLSCFHDAGFSLYNIFNLVSTSNGSLCQLDAIFTRKEPDSS